MLNVENKSLFLPDNLDLMWPKTAHDVVPQLPNYDIFRHRFPEDMTGLSWGEAIEELVRVGIMASSSHNMQQWKVEANQNSKKLVVFPDEAYIGIPADVTGREAHVSVGNFAENCIQFLHAYGIPPKVGLERRKGQKGDLTAVCFQLDDLCEGKLNQPDLIKLIQMRRVYRGPFDRTYRLPQAVSEAMQQMAKDIGLKLHIITSAAFKNPLGLFQFTANNIVLHQSDFRKELGQFLLPNDSLSSRGMSGGSFGLDDADAEEAHRELLEGKTLEGKFATGFPTADKNAIISSAATIVIMSPEDRQDNWLKGGMLMDRLWLYAQSQGLGVGVMAGMVEVATMASRLTKSIGVQGVPTSVLRLGKPLVETWDRSPRTSIEEVLTIG